VFYGNKLTSVIVPKSVKDLDKYDFDENVRITRR
jgi:hypothetical protein